jgi:hypothetical protein
MEIAELRSRIDMDNLYVEFGVLRAALTLGRIVNDLDVSLSEQNRKGECRAVCPKCGKEKSFSLNVNTNRFNCFAKGCALKGGGVIDFYAKLFEVSAKEASHHLACAYGIQPYTQEMVEAVVETNGKPNGKPFAEAAPIKREVEQLSPNEFQNIPPITPVHLIASIEHQLAELKQLLAAR